MNKKKVIFFVTIVSFILVILIAMKMLDTTGEINQGNFRINDLVVNSYAEVNEKDTNEEATAISDLIFDLSQNNKITILVAKTMNATRIYLDNITVTEPLKKGTLSLSQTDVEGTYDLSTTKTIEINPILQDDEYYIELNINNTNFMTDVKAPADATKVTFDGTFFKDLDINVEELKIEFECDLNIVDETGKESSCNLKFSFPSEDLLNNGISVLRQDLSKYVFELK